MYLGSDNYLGSTAYLGPGPNGNVEPIGDETVIQWRDITLHGKVGRFTIAALAGWDDLPDSRTQWDARPNQHGTFDAPVYASERHVMVGGNCFNKEQRDHLLRELKRAMTYGPYAEEFTVTHAGLRLSVAARLVRFNATYINWGEGAYGWQAEWVAADPFRYGAKRMAYTGLPELKGGLAFPLFTDGTTTGTSYAWTGTPGASTSTQSVDGVVVRENLSTNPSFEYGLANTTGYDATSTLSQSSAAAWRGTYSVRAESTGSSNRLGTKQTVDVPAGTHRVTVRIYVPEASMSKIDGTVRLSFSGADAVDVPLDIMADRWVEATAEISLTEAKPLFWVSVNGAWGAGDWAYIDGLSISATGPYFDGDTPDETIWGGGGWLDFGEAGSSGRITLRNEGDADAWPTLAVRGPAPQGFTITNVETGRRIVSNTVIPAGSTLTIHTAKGTAYLDGADRSGQLTVREWVAVPPGESYTFQFTAPTFTSAALVASARDTFW